MWQNKIKTIDVKNSPNLPFFNLKYYQFQNYSVQIF